MGLCSVNDLVAMATATKTTLCFQFNSNYCTCVPTFLWFMFLLLRQWCGSEKKPVT